MIERVDPYDHVEERAGWAPPSAEERVRARLDELRVRIAEVDAQVARLMARREELTRAAFDAATGLSGPEPA